MWHDRTLQRRAGRSVPTATCAIVLGAMVCSGAASADNGPRALKAAPPAAASPDTVIAIDLPAVWERETSLWDGVGLGDDQSCVGFQLQVVGPPPKALEIATTGIAGAVLGQGPASSSCRTAHGLRVVPIMAPTSAAYALELIAPAEAFPELSAGSKGQLIVIADGKALSPVTIILRRRGFPLVWQAPLWFLSIGTPAFLTAWIAFVFTRWQKRLDLDQQEAADLAAFYKANANAVREFFAGLFRNIIEDNAPNAAENMRRELIERGIFAALPSAESAKVAQALGARDWQTLSNVLARSFDDCKSLILGEAGG